MDNKLYFAVRVMIFLFSAVAFLPKSVIGAEYVPGEIILGIKDNVKKGEIDLLNSFNARYKVSSIETVSIELVESSKQIAFRSGSSNWVDHLSSSGSSNGTFIPSSSPSSKASLKNGRVFLVRVPVEADLEQVIKDYASSSCVEFAQPNHIIHKMQVPNDPYFSSRASWGQNYDDLWGLKAVSAPSAWDLSQGQGVVIAVVDSGIDYTHQDISANIWSNEGEISGNGIDDDHNGFTDDCLGWDFIGKDYLLSRYDNDPLDMDGHGTHVAGIIAASGNNGLGVIGLAYKAKVMAVRVLDDHGNGTDISCAAGIYYAADHGAKVINLSWGGEGESYYVKKAVEYACAKGCLLVAAAGNSSSESSFFYPANLPGVIAVAASDPQGLICSFSNYGPKIDLTAPGGGTGHDINVAYAAENNILSLRSSFAPADSGCVVGDDYLRSSGTSMAVPFVSATAALLFSKNPVLSADEAAQILKVSADDMDVSGWDVRSGYGRVNAYKALQVQEMPDVTAVITVPVEGAELRGVVDVIGTAVTNGKLTGYVLDYAVPVQGESGFFGSVSYNWVTIKESSLSVDNGVLGTFDTRGVPDGFCILRLRVSEEGSGYTSVFCKGVMIWNSRFAAAEGSFVSSVNLADLNNDGFLEVIAVDGYGKLYSWDRSGSLLPGWPVRVPVDRNKFYIYGYGYPGKSLSSGSGNGDIVISHSVKKSSISTLLIERRLTRRSSPAVGDVDGDGYLEVALAAGDQLFLLGHDGTAKNGWPKSLDDDLGDVSSPLSSSAVLADINGDGRSEIIIGVNKSVPNPDGELSQRRGVIYVFNGNGDLLDGWPKVCGEIDIPAVGDIDGDGMVEIAAAVNDIYADGLIESRVLVFDGKGNVKNGWPNVIQGNMRYSPRVILADVDNDRRLEVITLSVYRLPGEITENAYIYVFKSDGSLLNGWPQYVPYIYYGPLTVGDLDKDDQLEIIAVSYDSTGYCMLAFNADGTPVPGWTGNGGVLNFSGAVYNEPAIFDLDLDGFPEIVYGSWDGYSAWGQYVDFSFTKARKASGELLSGFSYLYGGGGASSIAAADIDLDGKFEIFVGGYDGYLYRFKTGRSSYSGRERSMYGMDQAHSGTYIRPGLRDTVSPSGYILINNGSFSTSSRDVLIYNYVSDSLSGMGKGAFMQFSNDAVNWCDPMPYSAIARWQLAPEEGKSVVYARFCDAAGNWIKCRAYDAVLYSSSPENRLPQNFSLRPVRSTVQAGEILTLTSQYSDLNGANDIVYCELLISYGSSFVRMGYNNRDATISLLGEDGKWMPWCKIGSELVLENKYVKLYCSQAEVRNDDPNKLSVSWPIELSNDFLGSKRVYMAVTDSSGQFVGWNFRGAVQIKGADAE